MKSAEFVAAQQRHRNTRYSTHSPDLLKSDAGGDKGKLSVTSSIHQTIANEAGMIIDPIQTQANTLNYQAKHNYFHKPPAVGPQEQYSNNLQRYTSSSVPNLRPSIQAASPDFQASSRSNYQTPLSSSRPHLPTSRNDTTKLTPQMMSSSYPSTRSLVPNNPGEKSGSYTPISGKSSDIIMSSNNFNQKLTQLKTSLSNIKLNLSSFKLSQRKTQREIKQHTPSKTSLRDKSLSSNQSRSLSKGTARVVQNFNGLKVVSSKTSTIETQSLASARLSHKQPKRESQRNKQRRQPVEHITFNREAKRSNKDNKPAQRYQTVQDSFYLESISQDKEKQRKSLGKKSSMRLEDFALQMGDKPNDLPGQRGNKGSALEKAAAQYETRIRTVTLSSAEKPPTLNLNSIESSVETAKSRKHQHFIPSSRRPRDNKQLETLKNEAEFFTRQQHRLSSELDETTDEEEQPLVTFTPMPERHGQSRTPVNQSTQRFNLDIRDSISSRSKGKSRSRQTVQQFAQSKTQPPSARISTTNNQAMKLMDLYRPEKFLTRPDAPAAKEENRPRPGQILHKGQKQRSNTVQVTARTHQPTQHGRLESNYNQIIVSQQKEQIDNLLKTNQSLAGQINQLKGILEVKQRKEEDLLKKLDLTEKKRADAENQFFHLKSFKIDLEGQLNICEQEKNFVNDRLAQVERCLKRKDHYISDLEAQLTETRDTHFSQSNVINNHKQDIADQLIHASEKLKSLQAENHSLKVQLLAKPEHRRGKGGEHQPFSEFEAMVMQGLKLQVVDDLPQALRQAHKEKKFCSRLNRLIKDVEGKKPDTLKDCWRWIKGLLCDFVQAKETAAEQARVLQKAEMAVTLSMNNRSVSPHQDSSYVSTFDNSGIRSTFSKGHHTGGKLGPTSTIQQSLPRKPQRYGTHDAAKKRKTKRSAKEQELSLLQPNIINNTALTETQETSSTAKQTFFTLEAMLDKHLEDMNGEQPPHFVQLLPQNYKQNNISNNYMSRKQHV